MKISEHCYAIQGLYFVPPWSVNSGFVVGNNSTLIIDTVCNYMSSETIYGYAKSIKPQNKIIVINTEKHLDHMGGNALFKEKKIDIYGHYLLKRNSDDFESLKEYFNVHIENQVRKKANEVSIMFSKSKIENPNKLIDMDTEIDLGGITVKIFLTPGHTNTNLIVYVPSDNAIYTGDTVVNKFIPNLEEGKVEEWNNWLNSLELINELDPEIVVPGHGKYISSNSEIKAELKRIKEIIIDAVKNNIAPTDM